MNTILVWVLAGMVWTGGTNGRLMGPPPYTSDSQSCEALKKAYARVDNYEGRDLQCVQVRIRTER